MSLQFVLGGSGSGKTRFLFEQVIRESVKEPGKQYIVLVPEQFTMETQKDMIMLHPNHGMMNIDIVSFERLAYRVFGELSVETLDVLDDMGKSMVLRKVAARKKKSLGLYQSHLSQAGFINQLKSMLSEFYQYGITGEMIEASIKEVKSPLLKQKLMDFSVILEGFKEYISQKYITAEEILDVLCRIVSRSELLKGSVVVLDGYTGFTPVQYRLLEQLMTICERVTVSISVDMGANPYKKSRMQNLFYMSKNTVCQLIDLAAKNGVGRGKDVELSNRPAWRFKNMPAMDFLEQELYRYRGKQYGGEYGEDFPITVFEGKNPKEEIRYALMEIHKMVQEDRLKYREIAIITGDLASYGRELGHQMEKEGIPYFLDQKKSILENPLVELIRAALEVIQKDFSYESVFRYLKTGLVTEEKEQMDRLENYVRALGIRGKKRWSEEWQLQYKEGENLNLEELNRFRQQALDSILPLWEGFSREDGNIGTMTASLREYLESGGFRERLSGFEEEFKEVERYDLAREYSQVYDKVMELLDRLETLLGDEKVSRKEFNEILDAGFAEIKVGVIPATVDRIVIGDITRTRLNHIRVLIFMGVNDGIVPQKKDGGSLLTDMEREALQSLHMELAPTAREDGCMQKFYLYLMMTKPEKRLILTYANAGGEGKAKRPSSLIHEVLKLFPGLSVLQGSQMKWEIYSKKEGREQLIESLRDYENQEERQELLQLLRLFFQSEEMKSEAENLLEAAFYSYEDDGIGKAAAQALYGKILEGSVTRLEQYAACAYAHFLRYGLELMERKEYELAPVDMGNLFHQSIDLCFEAMKKQGKTLADISEEERKKLVAECVREVSEQYGNTILKSSARNEYLAEKIARITDKTIWALAEQMKKGDFVPEAFEVSFSAIDNLKAMKIALSEEEALHLRGRIDRLDLYEDENHVYVKIIDYKSGSTSFNLAAFYYGMQLQLVVYMDAALELQERKFPGKEVEPAGIFYYHIADPVVETEEEEDIEALILKNLKMDGLVNSDLEIIRHLDKEIETESDVIPVVLKAGIIQETRSHVAGKERFAALRTYTRKRLKEAGQEILKGKNSVRPYKQGGKTACDYCMYHAVCGFDLKTKGYGYQQLYSMKAEEVWKEIMGREEE